MPKTRLAALAVAVPLAFAPAASVAAPNCYGVDTTIYCDPTLRVVGDVETKPTLVCVGTCSYVPVPTGKVGPVNVCLDYTDENGTAQTQCFVNTPTVLRAVLAALCVNYGVCL